MSFDDPTLLPWVDIETSGLNQVDPRAWIGEIGFAVTDRKLNIVDSINFVIMPPDDCLVGDGEWWVEDDFVRNMHTESGLFEAMRNGPTVTLRKAIAGCEEFLSSHNVKGRPLCGSSLRFDRNWLEHFAPRFHAEALHYRSIDVSSLMEIVGRWWPDEVPQPADPPKKLHRAISDITDSVEQLKSYMAILERGLVPFPEGEFQ